MNYRRKDILKVEIGHHYGLYRFTCRFQVIGLQMNFGPFRAVFRLFGPKFGRLWWIKIFDVGKTNVSSFQIYLNCLILFCFNIWIKHFFPTFREKINKMQVEELVMYTKRIWSPSSLCTCVLKLWKSYKHTKRISIEIYSLCSLVWYKTNMNCIFYM